jgi:molybdopterin synthase catalytic subunit/molybdopterin converting factor small subunit
MPKLNVLYFAHVRARVGVPSETLETTATTVSGAVSDLVRRHPALEPLLPRCRVALNGAFTGGDAPVGDGDELVLIPPVAGGTDLPRVHVGPELLSEARVAEVRKTVASAGHGAAVVFVGTVRDHARGHAVDALAYEAYVPMAIRELHRIVSEVEAAFPGVSVAVHHRTGDLVPTDVAVVVVAASAHRGPAFAACADTIDRLKRDVPIWKRERGPDGAEWIDDRP